MIGVLIQILIAVLILGLLYYLVTLVPLPPPFALIARVVFIIVCILVLVGLFWYPAGVHPFMRC
ncbi:hypothetical protein ADU20_27305 [Burkholderia pseudomallei]|uniref:hypothetical protein n=1 Tax=Burkholderia pseudomallei TaxID=28450 RepID=UPI000681924E|nr:hypothetical protein [Burkholderia pseudomallei]KNA31033.1 hypothetical protein ADU20_27305 [Burkholderia pseudomallei]